MKIYFHTLHNPFSRPTLLTHLDSKFCSLHRITNRVHRRKSLKIGIFANTAITARYIVEKKQGLYIKTTQKVWLWEQLPPAIIKKISD